MILVLAGGPQTVFPDAVGPRVPFAMQQEHVFEWAFRVINDMAHRPDMHDWDTYNIARVWKDLAVQKSTSNNSISLEDLFYFLSESLRLLHDCRTGDDFLHKLRQW